MVNAGSCKFMLRNFSSKQMQMFFLKSFTSKLKFNIFLRLVRILVRILARSFGKDFGSVALSGVVSVAHHHTGVPKRLHIASLHGILPQSFYMRWES